MLNTHDQIEMAKALIKTIHVDIPTAGVEITLIDIDKTTLPPEAKIIRENEYYTLARIQHNDFAGITLKTKKEKNNE